MIDDSQCFARHVANARCEGQSPVAVVPVKTDLEDPLGLGIARSSFARAAELFASASGVRPDDWLIAEYLHRAQRYAVQPPGPEWSGVEVLSEK